MQVSAKVDYGIRALLVLAQAHSPEESKLIKGEEIASSQQIPLKFLEGILTELRHAGFVISQRGAVGGYRLSRNPENILLADVVRILDGPLAAVRGVRPENVAYQAPAGQLSEVWLAVRVALREVLENVSLSDVLAGHFEDHISQLLRHPDSRKSRPIYESD